MDVRLLYTPIPITPPLMVVFATARKIKALVIGTDADTISSDADTISSDGVISDLKAASVPISSADCRICPDPCDEGAHWSRMTHIHH